MTKKRIFLDGFLFGVKEVSLGDVVFEMWTLILQLKCHMQGAEYEYLFVLICSASSADSPFF